MNKSAKKNLEYVFICEKTKKYHLNICPHAKTLKKITLGEAIKNEYIPCKLCINNKRI
jgi:hypothetical protein